MATTLTMLTIVINILVCCTLHTQAQSFNIHTGFQPGIGTKVSPYKNVLMGQSTIKVIFRLENIEQPVWSNYDDPCRLVERVRFVIEPQGYVQEADMERIKIKAALDDMCNTYRSMMNTQSSIAAAYGVSIDGNVAILNAMQPQKRTTRSIGSDIRHFFGMADENEQTVLQAQIEAITQELYTQRGSMVNMSFVIEQQNLRLTGLENAMKTYEEVLNSTISLLHILTHRFTTSMMITNTRLKLMEEVISLGNTQHHIMNLHTMMLQQRADGMLELAKGKLSPSLISPLELYNTLEKLDTALATAFPHMEHLRFNIYEFYTNAEVMGYRNEQNIYILLKIPLDFEDQNFKIYEIETFPIATPQSNYSTLVTPDHRFVAVSVKHTAYFLLDQTYMNLYCKGTTNLRCQHLQLQHHLEKTPACEISILTANVTQIESNCDIALVSNDQLSPSIIELNATHLFVSNPKRQTFYLSCYGQRHPVQLSSGMQFTLHLPCFCNVASNFVTTPTLFHDECVEFDREQPVAQKHENIIMAALLNAQTWQQIKNTSFEIPPMAETKFPEITRKVDDKTVIDAKKLIQMSYLEYKTTLYGRINANTGTLQTARISWFIPSLSTIIIVIVVLLIIGMVVLFKYNRMANLVTVMGLVRQTEAATIETTTPILISFELLMLVIGIAFIVYCVFKYFRIFQRVYRNITATCCESLTLYKPPASNVLLYIGNSTNYAYLHLGQLATIPHTLTIANDNSPIELTLHRSWLGGYITIAHQELCIQVDGEAFTMPTAVSVPYYLQGTADAILRHPPYTVQIAIGQDGIYRPFPLKSKSHATPTSPSAVRAPLLSGENNA